ncbi:hypothetical protein GX408_03760 [bacterium]|nr:hypothetical protein [bacterium]
MCDNMEWPLLITLALFTLSFGMIGFSEYFTSRQIMVLRLAFYKDHTVLCSLERKGCRPALSSG